MPHQPLTAVLAANTITGFHPGLAYYAHLALLISPIIGVPIYVVRRVRDHRKRR